MNAKAHLGSIRAAVWENMRILGLAHQLLPHGLEKKLEDCDCEVARAYVGQSEFYARLSE